MIEHISGVGNINEISALKSSGIIDPRIPPFINNNAKQSMFDAENNRSGNISIFPDLSQSNSYNVIITEDLWP
jgi:hypothetical protein